MIESRNKTDLTPILLAAILVVAAVIRGIYLIELAPTPFFRQPILDAQYYLNWGTKLAWGGFRVLPGFQGNPLYPYFLAFLIRIVNAGPLLIRIVQHGLGVVTCLLIFRSGRLLFGRWTGILAVLNSDPDNFRAWNNLGMAYKEEKEFNPAEKAFQKALRRNPDYAPSHTNLENLYVQQENMKRP